MLVTGTLIDSSINAGGWYFSRAASSLVYTITIDIMPQ
jgi:hypothetical protein